MARGARKQLADMRAMEHQDERQNIVDPRKPSSNEMLGSGATPSMGLSQVRGGKRGKHIAVCEDLEGGAKQRTREALQLGKEFAEELLKKHGSGFAKAFAGGYMYAAHQHKEGGNISKSGQYEGGLHGGAWPWEIQVDWNAPWSWSDFADGFVNGFTSTARAIGKIPGAALDFLVPGAGTVISGINTGLDYFGFGKRAKKGDPMLVRGGASWEGDENAEFSGHGGRKSATTLRAEEDNQRALNRAAMESAKAKADADLPKGGRKPKAKRAGAGPNDGRRARAEIVKKVMAQKGLSMIEASKYVKQHNLY